MPQRSLSYKQTQAYLYSSVDWRYTEQPRSVTTPIQIAQIAGRTYPELERLHSQIGTNV